MLTNTILWLVAAIALFLIIAVIVIICELHTIRHHLFESNVMLDDLLRLKYHEHDTQRERRKVSCSHTDKQ